MSDKTGPSPPPSSTRFQKGESGNPRGRPKGKKKPSGSVFDVILDRTLTVSQGGHPHEITVEEALQHQTLQEALNGSRSAQRELLKMIATREKTLSKKAASAPLVPPQTETSPDPTNADQALLLLGIAARNPDRQDPGFDDEQLLLEPWAVQLALSRRRGGKKLETREIEEIRRSTRNPDSLKWPRGTVG